MATATCLKYLPLFYGLVLGYTVNKEVYRTYHSKVFDAVRDEITGYLKRHNVSLQNYPEFATIWDDAEQILKEVAASEPSYSDRRIPHEPDETRNATILAATKGFLTEEHYVTTADGFILFLLRIKAPGVRPRTGPPVFLLHGLLSSCDCYINNFRNESLAFILADKGFDVWLGNIRGNRYTTRHTTLQPTDHEFWKWSFDEMGQYDVPVMVDYVISKSGHEKLKFIGHSEGTTNLITSVINYGKPLAEKIDKFIALGPAVYVSHSKGLMRQLANFARLIQTFWDLFDDGDIFSHTGLLSRLADKLCNNIPNTCSVILHSMVGTGLSHFNLTRIPVYLSHAPAGTSTQNMVHWSQQCESKEYKLKYYDYGTPWENYRHYKQIHPKVYDLSRFTIPTYAFFGEQDWLVSPPDAQQLIKDLPNLISATFYPDYNHLDFVWGYNVADTLFKSLLDILEA